MRLFKLHLFALFFTPLFISSAHSEIAQYPLFLNAGVPPVVLLTMGRDHKLYYEAYNDASDLNNDGEIDTHYKPSKFNADGSLALDSEGAMQPVIDYYGYFDSYKCYSYSSGTFIPVSTTTTKQCSGNWSGDFLNYITTSRIDAMRKVLYGGLRSTDTTSKTIITRSFIPQDAHSWGKEYTSVAVDGYDISNYTPLSQPDRGTRHLFANVSLSDTGQPLMRVLNDSTHRIWEWVAIERPVAGTECNTSSGSRVSCAKAASSSGAITIPDLYYKDLVRTTYDTSSGSGHPNNHSEFDTFISTYATGTNKFGSGSMTNLIGNDNNPYGSNDNYLTIVTGTITIPSTDTYVFSIDGDDAIEVLIDGSVVAGWYGGHGTCGGCTTHSGSVYLTAGDHSIEYRHEERGGGDSFLLQLVNSIPSSTMVDYDVNVEVCVTGMIGTETCKGYSDGTTTTYKPTGILQEYGDSDQMAFGLLTGSFQKNTSGGVLRKNIASFKDEIDQSTGIVKTSAAGIIKTLDKLKISRFNYGSKAYTSGWITTRAINEGEAQDWGNPVAEMMYEGLRYFAGKSSPTPAYSSGVDGGSLGLPVANWLNPYRTSSGGYAHCAKPVQLVISDINTSYDSDQLPGSYFNPSFSSDLTGMNVSTLADRIWAGESEASNIFIGQSGTDDDGTPSPKTVTSFSNIRGLAPEEPTKLGSYYAGSVGLYGQETDINSVQKEQNVDTLAVALASPLPRIEIPVDGKKVTLVPFAKSVGGSSISATSSFQPTNQIVDFFVETLVNTGTGDINTSINSGYPYGKFRINYEDVEQAADHDMDAIVEYEFAVDPSNPKQLVVSLDSTYAAGGIIQHMGYVISGTTQDGTYLEVRDKDTAAGSDPDYKLDTPPGQLPGGVWNDSTALPLNTSRTFTVGTSASASFIKHDPLWYAAKWSMEDKNGNGTLETSEWDSDSDGNPDGYFLVTNAGTLSEQLNKAFKEITARSSSSSSAVAANSTRLSTDTQLFQARFNSTSWTGDLVSLQLTTSGSTLSTTEVWNAASGIPTTASSRNILTYKPDLTTPSNSTGVDFLYANLSSTQQNYLNKDAKGTVDPLGSDRVDYIRGDNNLEEKKSGTFRNRSSLLGDIINSAPIFVGPSDNFGYSALSGVEGSSYLAFRKTKITRKPVVYFGANDGMLHAVHATEKKTDGGGDELFTYIPDAVISKLSLLTSPYYGCTNNSNCIPHSYYVDGSTTAGDAYISLKGGVDVNWRTILVGTTGRGGKGVFALNVTNPNSFSTDKSNIVMWEISASQTPNSTDLADLQNHLGYTMADPSIVKLQNGDWVVILANGYDSVSKQAVLFILDLSTGEILKTINTGIGSGGLPNGLSTPVPVDQDGDNLVDTIYAGDLQGNMWKFDVSDDSPTKWAISFKSGKPLYTAKDNSGNAQAITAKPEIGYHPDGGLMVYFGTGKYFEGADKIVTSTPPVHTFYALRDFGSDPLTSGRSKLQEQTIKYEASISALSLRVRVTSDSTVNYSSQEGWYMDLVSPVNGAEGERVVTQASLRGSEILFITLIPEEDPCGLGGYSWVMNIDAISGSILSNTPFDINNDDKFDESDLLKTLDFDGDGVVDPTGISGLTKDGSGILTGTTGLDKGNGIEIIVTSDTGREKTPPTCTGDDCPVPPTCTGDDCKKEYITPIQLRSNDPFGRQSWRQLR